MKTKSFALVLILTTALASAQTNNLTALLQQGLFEEQANRNLDAAIEDYAALARQFDKDRQLAATAVFRLGECYRAQGKSNEAAAQYQRILRDFSDQQTLATLSRQNLAGMGMAKTDAPPAAVENSDVQLVKELDGKSVEELEKILPTLIPDSTLDALLKKRYEAQSQRASLVVDYATNNPVVARVDALVLELNRQIKEKISGMMLGLKLRANLLPTAQTAGDPRSQQKELLAKQIALAEQDLADTQKRVRDHVVPETEVRAAEREVLRLQQQLAALDSNKADLLELSVPAGSEEDQEIARIQTMIQNSPDLINAPGEGGTPLVKAAYHGWLKAATYLLDHGADVSVACFSIPGRTDLLNMSNGNAAHITPLVAAVMAGNKAMAQFLIDRGADVNFKGQSGDTPLHLAAQKGFQAVIEVLLASRADVKAQNTGGATPLCSAVQSGQVKIVRMLLAAGADGNVQDAKGRTVLNYAIGTSSEIIQALLATGTNPNTEDSVGRTPLSYAAERDSSTSVKLLLDAKADPNGGKMDAPLLCAIGKNDAASVEMLLQAGAKPNAIGKFDLPGQSGFGGRRGGPLGGGFGSSTPSVTPLWLAISDNQFSLVQLLLKFKADPNDSQIDGRSLLFSALSDTNILESLLDAGAKVDAMGVSANVRVGNNAVNWTPLGEAAQQNNAAAVEILLKHGANPNVRDPVGNYTPLHWAADFLADGKVFELLLVYKAERNARDINGQTPLDILKEKAKADNLATDSAGKKKAGELADLLRQHGAVDNLPN